MTGQFLQRSTTPTLHSLNRLLQRTNWSLVESFVLSNFKSLMPAAVNCHRLGPRFAREQLVFHIALDFQIFNRTNLHATWGHFTL